MADNYFANETIMRELVWSVPDEVKTGHFGTDEKVLADLTPRLPLEEIAAQIGEKNWFEKCFSLPEYFADQVPLNSKKDLSIDEYIEKWYSRNTLLHNSAPESSTLIPLPHPYVTPGGRFQVMYYWDSFFTSLGLIQLGRQDIVVGIVKNMIYLIEKYGFIPNGNRTYYLSRSQPPFFLHICRLVENELLAEGIDWHKALKKEREFWRRKGDMYGEVHCPNKFDETLGPRAESYTRDVDTIADGVKLGRKAEDVAINLRAGAESGWDFSSRWLDSSNSLASIRVTEIEPMDLRALLAMYDQELDSEFKMSSHYTPKEPTKSLACVFPLFAKIASKDYAKLVAEYLEKSLLKSGGLLTTESVSGQQWDAPNGWAPLQWVAFEGLKNYGFDALAEDIAHRWIRTSEAFFAKYGVFAEKYNVEEPLALAGGGEYELQEGFGWSIGVYLDLRAKLTS